MNRFQIILFASAATSGATPAPAPSFTASLAPPDQLACVAVHYQASQDVTMKWATEVGDECHVDPLVVAVFAAQQLEAQTQAMGHAMTTFALLDDECRVDLIACREPDGF